MTLMEILFRRVSPRYLPARRSRLRLTQLALPTPINQTQSRKVMDYPNPLSYLFLLILALIAALLAIYHKEGEVTFNKRSAIFLGAGVLIVSGAWIYLHPAWQSPTRIRDSLLQVTPLGSSVDQVLSLAQERRWVPRNGSVDYHPSDYDPITLSGFLRHDPFPYRTWVSVNWIFNRSNQLAQISITRYE